MIVVALAVVLAGGVVLARTLLASPAAPPSEAATIWTSPASAPVLLAEPNGSGDYDPWAIDALLRFPNFASAFTLAYVAFHRAQPAVREKNSGPSPAGPTAAAGPAETPTAATGSS